MSLARRLKGTVYISDHEFHFPENLTKFDGSQTATASSWMQPGHVTSAASSSSNIPDCGPAPLQPQSLWGLSVELWRYVGSVPTGSVRKTARGFDSTATEHQRSSKCQTLPGSRRKEFVSMGTSSFRGREAKRLGWERLLESVWGFPESSLLKMIEKNRENCRGCTVSRVLPSVWQRRPFARSDQLSH